MSRFGAAATVTAAWVALLGASAGPTAGAAPRPGPPRAACPHPFHSAAWRVRFCLPDPFRVKAGPRPLGGHALLGPRTPWPFLDRRHRYLLQVRPREALRALRARLQRAARTGTILVTQVRLVREGKRVGLWYREDSKLQQCPGVRFVVTGPAHNFELSFPDCGLGPAFHREAERYFRAILRGMVTW